MTARDNRNRRRRIALRCFRAIVRHHREVDEAHPPSVSRRLAMPAQDHHRDRVRRRTTARRFIVLWRRVCDMRETEQRRRLSGVLLY